MLYLDSVYEPRPTGPLVTSPRHGARPRTVTPASPLSNTGQTEPGPPYCSHTHSPEPRDCFNAAWDLPKLSGSYALITRSSHLWSRSNSLSTTVVTCLPCVLKVNNILTDLNRFDNHSAHIDVGLFKINPHYFVDILKKEKMFFPKQGPEFLSGNIPKEP